MNLEIWSLEYSVHAIGNEGKHLCSSVVDTRRLRGPCVAIWNLRKFDLKSRCKMQLWETLLWETYETVSLWHVMLVVFRITL